MDLNAGLCREPQNSPGTIDNEVFLESSYRYLY